VAYPDTDQMGTMHHANYAKYYELARWEMFRSIGIPYKSLEASGVMCPVVRMNSRFIKTTRYDEMLTLRTILREVKGLRMWFDYKLYNEKGELIHTAETELTFVGRDDWKLCMPPAFLLEKISEAVGE